MSFTNENIPIACSECNEIIEGIVGMVYHIIDRHKEYTPEEASKYACLWAEMTYEDIETDEMKRALEWRRNHGHAA